MQSNLQNISQETIDLAKQAFANGPTALAKDATTTGITVGTGLVGYELEAPAKSLYPVVTKFRNRVARKKAPVGSTASNWRAITAVNVAQASPFSGFGNAGTVIQTKEQDFSAAYKPLSLGHSVQMDAQALARGFDDLRARAGVDLLYSLMIQENIALIGAQAFSLGTPATPTATVSTTGGSIGAVNVGIKVAARTTEGLYYTGVGITNSSAERTTGALTGTTNQVTATVTALPGAAQYDWYVGAAGGPWYWYASTAVNKATITSVPTSGTQAPTADTSADSNAFNGFIASLINGATGYTYNSLDGATLTGNNGSITEIDNVLLTLYQNYKLSPTALVMAPQQVVDVSNKVVASGGARFMLPPADARERSGIVAGNLVTTYMNKAAGGELIEILSDPYWPVGRIGFLTERLPFPNSNVSDVLEVETQQEYQQIEYAMARSTTPGGGPRYDFEVRTIEVFKNFFPAGMALLDNVANG